MEMIADLARLVKSTFPGKPHFTEKDIPSLSDKVYIVTGASGGVGKELAQILYSRNAKVYLAARSESKALAAMDEIKTAAPDSKGHMAFLRLDLADLSTVKATAEEFLSKESKLDVLFNNAGVGWPEPGSKTAQGYELQLGVNCVGPFLLTKLLTPTLINTAKTAPKDSVRIVWVSSSASQALNPKNFVEGLDYEKKPKTVFQAYAASKIGNVFHATEAARRLRDHGVVSVALNPGNLDSELWRTQSPFVRSTMRHTILHPSIYGAYTELFAGLSPDVTLEKTGAFIAPWGRTWDLIGPLARGAKPEAEGGEGSARKFWEWSERQVSSFE